VSLTFSSHAIDSLTIHLYRSGILPLSELCIHPERAAWVLYVDATCINYDGNVFDAALIAMVAALKNSASP
jgi:exosome complex component RRP43